MKDKYYTVGTLIGLLMVVLVSYYVFGEDLWDLIGTGDDGKINALVPTASGFLVALGLGFYFDLKAYSRAWIVHAIALPVVIFLGGTLVGVSVNALINSENDRWHYFLGPLYWLTVVGVPLSIVIGVTYSFIWKRIFKN